MGVKRMDHLYEQLFKKKKTGKDHCLRAAIFLATLVISAVVFFLLCNLIPNAFGRLLGSFAIIGVVYAGYKLFMLTDVEYEYIYMAGEIDFDRILAKSYRKRILTVRCSEFEDFGEWNQSSAERLKNMPLAKRYDFTSNQGGAVYYAVLNRKEVGKIAVLFEPEERILTDMKRYIKR